VNDTNPMNSGAAVHLYVYDHACT